MSKFGVGYFKDNVQDKADAYDPSQHYYRRGAGAPAGAGPGGLAPSGSAAQGFGDGHFGHGGLQGYADGGQGQFGAFPVPPRRRAAAAFDALAPRVPPEGARSTRARSGLHHPPPNRRSFALDSPPPSLRCARPRRDAARRSAHGASGHR